MGGAAGEALRLGAAHNTPGSEAEFLIEARGESARALRAARQALCRWKLRKSSRSSANTDCVEVRSDLTAIRDSKSPNGPVLELSRDSLRQAVKSLG
ncbi:DUF397 domain-containing protein [Actinokineospora sp. G85]|uniref:DUF397 domain-containing protein n=1 Tax=Actinokineospora sp. G85 TaxID=3406626 RepID=UPI003C772B8F